jgi:hypothetical protein
VGSGTDVAIVAADMILLRDDLGVVPDATALGWATFRTIRRNLAWAFWNSKFRQLTDVSDCNLQQHFWCNRHRAVPYLPGPSPREQPQGDQHCPGPAETGPLRNPMNVMAPTSGRTVYVPSPAAPGFAAAAMTGSRMGEDLMTRKQVAYLFRVTSATVATWARRGRLPEVRNQAGKPRYRRADVEALFRSGFRRRTR